MAHGVASIYASALWQPVELLSACCAHLIAVVSRTKVCFGWLQPPIAYVFHRLCWPDIYQYHTLSYINRRPSNPNPTAITHGRRWLRYGLSGVRIPRSDITNLRPPPVRWGARGIWKTMSAPENHSWNHSLQPHFHAFNAGGPSLSSCQKPHRHTLRGAQPILLMPRVLFSPNTPEGIGGGQCRWDRLSRPNASTSIR